MYGFLYFVLLFQQQPHFTGNIVYKYSGWDDMVDTTEFVIGEDFYFKRQAGDLFRRRPNLTLFKESINDLANNKIYHIYDSRVEVWENSKQGQAKLSDIVVGDTVEYLGYQCQVIEFKQNSYFNGLEIYYRYYYPINLKFTKLFESVPSYFHNRNTFFRNLNQSFLPIYIESHDARTSAVRTIEAIEINEHPVSRSDYFLKVGK